MFKATAVRMSALSKRTKKVQVQLLKDFPMFNLFKGQVSYVKPSFMRNYLHNFNGARYIMKDSDIDLHLLQKHQAREAQQKEKVKDTPSIVKTEIAVDVKPSKKEESTVNLEEKLVEKRKGVLEKEITIEDVKIPGLDL